MIKDLNQAPAFDAAGSDGQAQVAARMQSSLW